MAFRSGLIPVSVALALCLGGAARADVRHVCELRVEGNDRTAEGVILRAAQIGPGTAYTDDLPDVVRQRVYNLRVFDQVSVEPSLHEGAMDLVIRVKERWTLLPVPFASAGNGAYRAGVLLVDTNFVGEHKTAIAGGYYGNRGSGAFVFYLDPEVAGSRWQGTLQLAYYGALREQYDGASRVYAYRERRAAAQAALGYHLTRALTVMAGWGATDIDPSAEDGFMAPAGGGLEHGPTLLVDLDASDFQLYFQEGLTGRLRVESSLAALGGARSLVRVDGRLQLATGVIADHALIVTGQVLATTSDSLLDVIMVGGATGARGFRNQGRWARDAETLALEYHVPFWRPSWGVWTALGFVDAGTVRWDDGRRLYVQPGAGMRLYLRQLALPALGIDVAYAPDENSALVVFSAGITI
jgi:outer membrane protein assembly factor BamA